MTLIASGTGNIEIFQTAPVEGNSQREHTIACRQTHPGSSLLFKKIFI